MLSSVNTYNTCNVIFPYLTHCRTKAESILEIAEKFRLVPKTLILESEKEEVRLDFG